MASAAFKCDALLIYDYKSSKGIKSRVACVENALAGEGFEVFQADMLSVDTGSVERDMRVGIDGCSVVIFFLTWGYINNVNGEDDMDQHNQKEFKYSFSKSKPFIFVVMDANVGPINIHCENVGLDLRETSYIDMSKEEDFDAKINKLITALTTRLTSQQRTKTGIAPKRMAKTGLASNPTQKEEAVFQNWGHQGVPISCCTMVTASRLNQSADMYTCCCCHCCHEVFFSSDTYEARHPCTDMLCCSSERWAIFKKFLGKCCLLPFPFLLFGCCFCKKKL